MILQKLEDLEVVGGEAAAPCPIASGHRLEKKRNEQCVDE